MVDIYLFHRSVRVRYRKELYRCPNRLENFVDEQVHGDADDAGDRVLGEDAGDEISLKKGRFGPYIQRGEATEEQPKPPRASLPKGWAINMIESCTF